MIWCAEHKASVGPDDPLDGPEDHCLRWYYDWDHPNAPTLTDCRMVEVLLIVKENGEWPDVLRKAMRGDWWERHDYTPKISCGICYDYQYSLAKYVEGLIGVFASVQPETET